MDTVRPILQNAQNWVDAYMEYHIASEAPDCIIPSWDDKEDYTITPDLANFLLDLDNICKDMNSNKEGYSIKSTQVTALAIQIYQEITKLYNKINTLNYKFLTDDKGVFGL